jgi:hypothetical protein
MSGVADDEMIARMLQQEQEYALAGAHTLLPDSPEEPTRKKRARAGSEDQVRIRLQACTVGGGYLKQTCGLSVRPH